jgi:hypothetical protein
LTCEDKGQIDNLENSNGMALLLTSSKIYTGVLAKRIKYLMERRQNTFPFQTGFSNGRRVE